jgi:hypothetical protein
MANSESRVLIETMLYAIPDARQVRSCVTHLMFTITNGHPFQHASTIGEAAVYADFSGEIRAMFSRHNTNDLKLASTLGHIFPS